MALTSTTCPSCRAALAPEARFCGGCGRTLAPAAPVGMDALPGRVIAGRYRVLAKLGAGGMGTVFRAEQVSVKRQIALKVLDPAVTANLELLRRFQAEAEVVARLSHPHTVTLFDFGQDEGGLLYIAMELAEGRSLRDVIAQEGPLAPFRAADIAEQIASSLADAHGHGVVHRDLKPDNVILSERAGKKDFARVLDFGIAKLYDDGTAGTQMTRAGQILGTPQYMAPEQIMAQPVDGRTDVYALGVMLYEMLSGAAPFTAPSLIALLGAHVNEPPPPLGAAVPPPLARLVGDCLAKQPAQRPRDMQTVAAALADIRALLDPGPRRTPSPAAPAFTPPPSFTRPPPAFTPMPAFTPPPPAFTPAPAPALPLATEPVRPLPPPRRSRAGLAATLVLLGAGAAVAAFVALRPHDEAALATTPPSDPPPASASETFRSARWGYAIELWPGFSMSENDDGRALGRGIADGNVVSLAVVTASSGADLDARAAQIEEASGGAAQIVERRTRRIRDEDLVSIVYDIPSAGARFETVFYPGATPLAVTIAAPPVFFDDSAALRDSLFRDRFQPHP